jgi:hypothetical protein
MHWGREGNKKIGLIISNILEKLSGLIIPNRGSMRAYFLEP